MLKEIICDRFKQPKIILNKGLNVVIGDSNASNSIGKSSLLMIVDFVYGGETYSKSTDIIDNIGHHEIKFLFEFCGLLYYYSRKTDESQTIYICNEEFEHIDSISLSDYNNRLCHYYSINLPSISFRSIVNTYSRVYGKDNYNEKYPLESFKGDTLSEGVNRLIKLFGLYDNIEKFDAVSTYSKDKYATYIKAENFDIMPHKITKAEYIKNSKLLQQLRVEEELSLNTLGTNSVDIGSENIELISILRMSLNVKKRERRKLMTSFEMLSNNHLNHLKSITQEEVSALIKFFPMANIQSIEKIDEFHKNITKFVDSEITKQIELVEVDLKVIDEEITKIMQSITAISGDKTPSVAAINNLMYIKNRIREFSEINNSFETRSALKGQKKEAQDNLKEMKLMTVCDISTKLNSLMSEINDFIYSAKKQSPQIQLTEKNYKFNSHNDTGTGTAYKNLIVLDLSILKLTQLPILIHDSVLYKNVSYDATDKIIESYMDIQKQIFIAFDGQKNYSDQTQLVLQQHTIITLGPNEGSLFGKSWTNK